jgi:pectinesterase
MCIPGIQKFHLLAKSKEHTIIIYNDYFDKINIGRNSTFHTSTVLIEGNDFIPKIQQLKIQPVKLVRPFALSVNATRLFFENCAFSGYSYTSGEGFKQYFKNCYIEGSTYFIFGEATVFLNIVPFIVNS